MIFAVLLCCYRVALEEALAPAMRSLEARRAARAARRQRPVLLGATRAVTRAW
jgi:hypothetical protein